VAAEGRRESRFEPRPEVRVRKDSINSESTEEEKNHVIKVLQHESNLYNFEKNVKKMMG